MKKPISVMLMLLLSVGLLLAFQQGDIPPANDPTHPGQPLFCQNYPTREFKENCDCKPKPGDKGCGKPLEPEDPDDPDYVPESAKCKVYCRKEMCKCSEKCTTHMRNRPDGHHAE